MQISTWTKVKAKFKDKERKRIKRMNMTSEETKSFNLIKKEQMKSKDKTLITNSKKVIGKKKIIQNKSV